ncbi:4'-phosphopantetheinyl transferase [Cokeromyces recurvatus]|uniref:4'-phosphopantetheinyl transferase n=1 Tax=Cokeromyces recurvatus TaxID=90255 RepID=UPI00221E6BF8|nr:4'-phosphopantetheinyl transferase [Cokeromyces recurvatus]KAI7900423.1 4'-phosphopantetheinyl transferase [Cokeromyces recurvatus]
MILGIGVDIVHLSRIAAIISRRGRDRFARRILSPIECKEFQLNCSSSSFDDQKQLTYLSSRWCIKEATYKALYPIHKLEWKQVTSFNLENKGKPEIDIVNSEKYGIQKAHLSLSHDGEYAISQVILEGKSK